jgi:exodeoxyribonuclease VII large subunit
MTVDGVGDLHVAFEQLKKKLEGQGMFDPSHKKPLPQYPGTICIITSPAGAAVHDMLRILNKRYPLIKVKLLPVRVQGQEAPEEIASAIAYANAYNLADLLIVGRGGGSLEDLWAFNTEPVARSIFQSRIPVISAVGHEPDVTISDYVADLRAATPSNAAELAVKDQFSIRQRLDQLEATMAAALQTQLAHGRQKLSILRRSAVLSAPDHWVKQNKKELLTLRTRLLSAAKNGNSIRRNRFISCAAKLDAMSPLKVLSRGYSVVSDTSGKVITSTHQVHKNDEISIRMSDGMVRTIVTQVEDTTNE